MATTTKTTTKAQTKPTAKAAANGYLNKSQLRVLRSLEKQGCLPQAGKTVSRKQIIDDAFNGNSINMVPILDPMIANKYITKKVINGDAGKVDTFALTAAGKKASQAAPADLSRGAGSHESLPKVGGSFTKIYKGTEVKVTVTKDGFQIGKETYPSLTAAAKAVRGTDSEINGWAFFGLVKPKAE